MTDEKPTSMISPCQEGNSSPDALREERVVQIFQSLQLAFDASRQWFLRKEEPDIHLLSRPEGLHRRLSV